MNKDTYTLVQAIHNTPHRLVLVTAGAGTQALSDLLGVAGASRTLLEAIVPYSKMAFDEFLGQSPDKYVTAEVAGLLAGRAYTRARWLTENTVPTIGVACTATIITDRPKRGKHRAFIATWQPERINQYSLYLEKGARDRTAEESLVSNLLLNALADALALDLKLPLEQEGQDQHNAQQSNLADFAQRLHQQEIAHFGVTADGRIDQGTPQAILSGAFNPLHDGHLGLAKAAQTHLNLKKTITFECAAVNVDKPPLSPHTLLNRIAQFAGRWPVYASNAPTYLEKSRLYPQATFIVGFDTAERILHPRYYQNSQENRNAALHEIQANGCTFLVAGRLHKDGSFRDLTSLAVPPPFQSLFHNIPAETFRVDISSTELRAQGLQGSR